MVFCFFGLGVGAGVLNGIADGTVIIVCISILAHYLPPSSNAHGLFRFP